MKTFLMFSLEEMLDTIFCSFQIALCFYAVNFSTATNYNYFCFLIYIHSTYNSVSITVL